MKVLAERSNTIFFLGPPIIAMCFFYMYMYWFIWGGTIRFHRRYSLLGFVIVLLFSTLYNFIHRLFIPKIIIEYDKAGIYVYNKRRGDPIIIRFEHLWSSMSFGGEDAFDELDKPEYVERYYLNKPLPLYTGCCSCNMTTGTLRIELPNQFITLHGIKEVGVVRLKLDSLVRKHYEEKMAFYEEQMMKRQREVELEELRKHDPNT